MAAVPSGTDPDGGGAGVEGKVEGLVRVPWLTRPSPTPLPPGVLQGFLNVFVELVGLSACDFLVHTKSGFRWVW